MAKTKTKTFDAADYLRSDEDCRAYLNAILEEGDTELFLSALGDVAKAKGMAKVAENSELGRESLYKAFAPGRKPQFETVFKVTKAIGFELKIA